MTTLNFDPNHTDSETIIETLAQHAYDAFEFDECPDFDGAVELYGGDDVEDAIVDMGEDDAVALYNRRLVELHSEASSSG